MNISFERQRADNAQSRYRMEPVAALKAMRRLIANKEDTAQVFEIIRALSGRSTPKGYMRMLQSAEGARQAYRAEEFADRLNDQAWLGRFGPGTLGAAYRDFLAPRGLSAAGLTEEASKAKSSGLQQEHPYAWFARRKRDLHDVWHVLTGYGTDALGEACVVAFSYAQTRDLGFAFIALAAAVKFSRLRDKRPYVRAIIEGYRRGKRASWLPQEDYERLFGEDLAAVRARLKIEPAEIYMSIPVERREWHVGEMPQR